MTKYFCSPGLEPEVLNLVLYLLMLRVHTTVMQIEELNERCQISFALRSYVEVDEDFKIKKVMLDSFNADTFVLAKKCSLKDLLG